jgi:hypothetical protein
MTLGQYVRIQTRTRGFDTDEIKKNVSETMRTGVGRVHGRIIIDCILKNRRRKRGYETGGCGISMRA